MKTIVFLAKHETNLLIKGVSSKYFDTIITIIIYNNDFTSISCIHTFIYLLYVQENESFYIILYMNCIGDTE